jgi:tetrapyrrole methylase family protein/MazG family protein
LHIIVVGLGSGDEDQLTLGVWKKLQAAKQLYLRTDQHPMVHMLARNGIAYESFDTLYESNEQFEQVYEAIASALLAKAAACALADNFGSATGEIVYAVPGHPMVAEKTVQLLKERCPQQGIQLTVLGGESFLDQAFLRLGFDPIEGFQMLNGSDLSVYSLNPQLHTVIAQVYDTYTASDVKLTLMELYPDEQEIVVGHALGVEGEEMIHRIPLYELDHLQDFGNLSLVWVPRSDEEHLRNRTFARLHEIVDILRSPEGCPWDREQTHQSLRKNLIEEAYEVLETFDEDDPDHMAEELGDLLLQVMLHAQIEAETGSFNVWDVIATLNEKLLRRHPHVFGEATAGDSAEALVNWNQIKQEEKRKKGMDLEQLPLLSGVPRELPGLMKAYKLQKKASAVGFDWNRLEDVIDVVQSEWAELLEAIDSLSKAEQQEELGDLLFAVVNLARFLRIEPEEAMEEANCKFFGRFGYIEQQLRLKGKNLVETDLQEMEALWQEAKNVGRHPSS